MSHKRQWNWKSPRMRNSLVQTCLRATYSFRCHASRSVVGSSDSSLPLPCTPPCTAVSALIPSPTTANAGPFLIPFLPPSHSCPDSAPSRPGPGGELSPASQPPFAVSTMAPSRVCHQWPMAAFHGFRSFLSVATLVQLSVYVGLSGPRHRVVAQAAPRVDTPFSRPSSLPCGILFRIVLTTPLKLL